MPTYLRPIPDGISVTEKVIVNVVLTSAVMDVGLTINFGNGCAKVGVNKPEPMTITSRNAKRVGYNLGIKIIQDSCGKLKHKKFVMQTSSKLLEHTYQKK